MKNSFLVLFFLAVVFIQTASAAAAEPVPAATLGGNWQIYGDSPHYLDLGLGSFDADEETSSAALRAEFRFGRKLFYVGPAIGLIVNDDDGYYGYGGLYADIVYRKLVITPLGAIGAYEEGNGKYLGGTFQFRAAITLSYQFDNLMRLGVQGGHISNANSHSSNPSEQDLLVTFAIPF